MRIKAKIGGELNRPAHWIHAAGDERDFPEDVGNKILTNTNYEKASARPASSEKVKEKEITTEAVVKKSEPGRKERKDREGTK